jgi:uncharacterized protein YodC (DUF2158 family)
MALKIGDIVKLKSGGPEMTAEVIADNTVSCIWIDKSKLCTRDFLEDILVEGAAREIIVRWASEDPANTCSLLMVLMCQRLIDDVAGPGRVKYANPQQRSEAKP